MGTMKYFLPVDKSNEYVVVQIESLLKILVKQDFTSLKEIDVLVVQELQQKIRERLVTLSKENTVVSKLKKQLQVKYVEKQLSDRLALLRALVAELKMLEQLESSATLTKLSKEMDSQLKFLEEIRRVLGSVMSKISMHDTIKAAVEKIKDMEDITLEKLSQLFADEIRIKLDDSRPSIEAKVIQYVLREYTKNIIEAPKIQALMKDTINKLRLLGECRE